MFIIPISQRNNTPAFGASIGFREQAVREMCSTAENYAKYENLIVACEKFGDETHKKIPGDLEIQSINSDGDLLSIKYKYENDNPHTVPLYLEQNYDKNILKTTKSCLDMLKSASRSLINQVVSAQDKARRKRIQFVSQRTRGLEKSGAWAGLYKELTNAIEQADIKK